jgi:hypothetical protein
MTSETIRSPGDGVEGRSETQPAFWQTRPKEAQSVRVWTREKSQAPSRKLQAPAPL